MENIPTDVRVLRVNVTGYLLPYTRETEGGNSVHLSLCH